LRPIILHFSFFIFHFSFHLGEPLRRKQNKPHRVAVGLILFALASGYPLHHLPRKRGRWFRYYPSRAARLYSRKYNLNSHLY
jgi:hypothetical protein